ncbi:hypothetical protein [Thermococcus sp.]|uniref:hypothetical protein n=1 Tax=Thermococcus sp. TaxID=35749 RepID=UPI002601AA08|nr:hypothetical protein [Thermococcus sp.]
MIEMEGEVFATVLSAIIGVVSFGYNVIQGKGLSRMFFKSNLLYHSTVKREYESLKKQALEYSRGYSKRDGLLIGAVIVNISLFCTILAGKFNSENKETAFLFFIIGVLWVFLNLWFILLKKALISEVQLEHNKVKNALNGSAWIFLGSVLAVMTIGLRSSLIGSPAFFYSIPVIVAGIGAVLSALIFSTIINTGTALLWKINISNNSLFANKLPHLLVKTKTGSVFFGQLYDPLDSKALVLRKSKLMHGGQIVEDKNDLILYDLILWTSQESTGDYWIVPWDDIESIKIIEEGLYAPPESSTDNSIFPKHR